MSKLVWPSNCPTKLTRDRAAPKEPHSDEPVVQTLGLLEMADAGVGVAVVAADRVGAPLAGVVRTETVYACVSHLTPLSVATDVIHTQF